MTRILPQASNSIPQSIQILKRGGVVAHAADTCYGLLGDFLNQDSLKKIQQLKGRQANKPMSVMLPLSHKGRVGEYTQLNEFSAQVCKQLLPGPVTLVLPKGSRVPEWYFPETNLIGLRIPDSQEVQELLEAFGNPLITTSANPSAQPVCRSPQEVINAFGGQENVLELVLESKQELGHLPSTVIQVDDHFLHVLRSGPMSEDEIQEKLKGLKFEIAS